MQPVQRVPQPNVYSTNCLPYPTSMANAGVVRVKAYCLYVPSRQASGAISVAIICGNGVRKRIKSGS